MIGKGIRLLFFGNYFVGFLAVALSVEAALQLQIPLNQPVYYLAVALSVFLYYTYAYAKPGDAFRYNPRSEWYARHEKQIRVSQWIGVILLAFCSVRLFWSLQDGFQYLHWQDWLLLLSFPLAAVSYYGLLPASPVSLNLRNTGWLKAFVIGFVWAGMVTIFPLYYQKLRSGFTETEPALVIWFFVKNWMFCTVNAIIFDMKDYASDANQELKTFVVRMGLRKTIFYVLLPLTLCGMTALLIFGCYQEFRPVSMLLNMIPFVCLLLVAWSMHLRRNIMYYLIVIDGMLLVKAGCGMLGVWLGNVIGW